MELRTVAVGYAALCEHHLGIETWKLGYWCLAFHVLLVVKIP